MFVLSLVGFTILLAYNIAIHKEKKRIYDCLVSWVVGAIFGLGLIVSGMVKQYLNFI